ncbi:sialate O-acetylesterase [Arundinibacter roseus]|uniref:Sialate O-acetylesterase n=1 Tax=Arundinibacter roseus TaxID=2070510 RepID=A0A4R4KKS2_9BACT|nr:sialate O-acetylesterase [Arundinibacter roseus]TDB68874.1 sialate O-acetylesterase [Arundinibacter roseus]
MRLKLHFLVGFLVLLSTLAQAQLRVARIFGDHMVLQRNKPIEIWGWASKGDKVELTLNQQKVTTQAAADGKWKAQLPAMPAGGPYELSIKTKKQTVLFSDILLGEVWLLSGQSNMEWRVRQADSARSEMASANFPTIRHVEIPHTLSFVPESDVEAGSWQLTTPETVGSFSAVGYFFARELSQNLNVPVGLIHSSWGASQVEGWISEKAMADSDVLSEYPKTMARTWEQDAQNQERKLISQLYGKADFDINAIDESAYTTPIYDFTSWKVTVDPATNWDWQGVWAFRGSAYLQRTVDIPEEFAAMETTLNFGRINHRVSFFINGKKMQEGNFTQSIELKIPAGTWQKGFNSLVLKIEPTENSTGQQMAFSGSGADFSVAGAGKKVLLQDKRWRMMPSWKAPRSYVRLMNNVGTTLYNAMIAPLIPYTIAGALWYQGESNAGRAYEYRKSFPLLISSWRKDWGYDFPFLFVQLATYGPFQNSNQGSEWAELREAQTMTLSLPNTGMAVTTDIGNPNDIHPTNKQDVGKRLALSALKVAYGQELVHSGPMYKEAQFADGKAVISFEHTGSGLVIKDRYGYLKGFEIAGKDQKFYYAPARIEGNKVVVSHPDVPQPAAVRYGWANSPLDNNLFNVEGLPAVPFRTDNWKGKTEGVKFR